MAPSLCWFLLALCLPLTLTVAAAAEACSGTCRDLTITDPFWLTDLETGRSCGSLDFEITCLNNTPILPSSIPTSPGFAIMDISYEEESMRVVELGKLRLLPASNTCNMPIWNTSEKLGGRPLRIDPVVNLNLVLYNCTANASAVARRDGGLVETRMRCGNESRVFVGVEGRYEEMSAVDGCDAVVLPVLAGTNGKANASDYERLIRDGFIFTWKNHQPLASVRAEGCLPEQCGNLTVSSPFGLVSGSEGENRCAQLGFQVHCTSGIPYLGYYEAENGLQILDIFYANASLFVSDVHKLAGFNHSSRQGCYVPTANTASKIGNPFSISPLNRNLVFYNCTKVPAPRTVQRAGLVEAVCRNNTFARAGGRYDEPGDYAIEGCNDMAVTVRGPSAGELNASDYLELISDGFLLTWQPPPAGSSGK